MVAYVVIGVSTASVAVIFRVKSGELVGPDEGPSFAQNVEVSFLIFQVVASPKVIASCYPRLPTLAPIGRVKRGIQECSLDISRIIGIQVHWFMRLICYVMIRWCLREVCGLWLFVGVISAV